MGWMERGTVETSILIIIMTWFLHIVHGTRLVRSGSMASNNVVGETLKREGILLQKVLYSIKANRRSLSSYTSPAHNYYPD